jgi:hypothetical protein
MLVFGCPEQQFVGPTPVAVLRPGVLQMVGTYPPSRLGRGLLLVDPRADHNDPHALCRRHFRSCPNRRFDSVPGGPDLTRSQLE